MTMNEAEFAILARQYVGFLDRQQALKPPGWSQEQHTYEHEWRLDLLDRMRTALGPRVPTYRKGLGQARPLTPGQGPLDR
jgi:hypothetical protein